MVLIGIPSISEKLSMGTKMEIGCWLGCTMFGRLFYRNGGKYRYDGMTHQFSIGSTLWKFWVSKGSNASSQRDNLNLNACFQIDVILSRNIQRMLLYLGGFKPILIQGGFTLLTNILSRSFIKGCFLIMKIRSIYCRYVGVGSRLWRVYRYWGIKKWVFCKNREYPLKIWFF